MIRAVCSAPTRRPRPRPEVVAATATTTRPAAGPAGEPDPRERHEQQERARRVPGDVHRPVVRAVDRDAVVETTQRLLHVLHRSRGRQVLRALVQGTADPAQSVHEREREHPGDAQQPGRPEQAAPSEPIAGPVQGRAAGRRRKASEGRAWPDAWAPAASSGGAVPARTDIPSGDGTTAAATTTTRAAASATAEADAAGQRHRAGPCAETSMTEADTGQATDPLEDGVLHTLAGFAPQAAPSNAQRRDMNGCDLVLPCRSRGGALPDLLGGFRCASA